MTVSESFLLHSPAQVNIQLIHESPPPLPVAHRYSLHSPAMVHSHIIHLGYIHSIKLTRVHIGNKAASVVTAQNQKQRKYISMIPLVRCNVVAVPVENSTTSLWSDTRLATSLWSDTRLAVCGVTHTLLPVHGVTHTLLPVCGVTHTLLPVREVTHALLSVEWHTPCYQSMEWYTPCYQSVEWHTSCYQSMEWHTLLPCREYFISCVPHFWHHMESHLNNNKISTRKHNCVL